MISDKSFFSLKCALKGLLHLHNAARRQSHTVYCVISCCLSKSHANLTRLSIGINLHVNLHVLNPWSSISGRSFLGEILWLTGSDAFYMSAAAATMVLVEGIEEELDN